MHMPVCEGVDDGDDDEGDDCDEDDEEEEEDDDDDDGDDGDGEDDEDDDNDEEDDVDHNFAMIVPGNWKSCFSGEPIEIQIRAASLLWNELRL